MQTNRRAAGWAATSCAAEYSILGAPRKAVINSVLSADKGKMLRSHHQAALVIAAGTKQLVTSHSVRLRLTMAVEPYTFQRPLKPLDCLVNMWNHRHHR